MTTVAAFAPIAYALVTLGCLAAGIALTERWARSTN